MKFVAAAIAVPTLLAVKASANCADDILSAMMDSFQPEKAAGLSTNVLFEISGDETGPGCVFNVDIKDGKAKGSQGGRRRHLKGGSSSSSTGNGSTEGDEVDFQFNAKTFEAINSGKMSGLMAWVKGDLKVKGSIASVLKFDAAFPSGSAETIKEIQSSTEMTTMLVQKAQAN